MKSSSSMEVMCHVDVIPPVEGGFYAKAKGTSGVVNGQRFEFAISNASSSSFSSLPKPPSTEALYTEFDGILKSLGIETQSSEKPEMAENDTETERLTKYGTPDALQNRLVLQLQQSPEIGSVNAVMSPNTKPKGDGLISTPLTSKNATGSSNLPEKLKKELLNLGNEYSTCLHTTCIKCPNVRGAFKLEFRSTLPDTTQPVCLAIGVTEDYPVECPDLFNLSQLPFPPADQKTLELEKRIGHYVRVGLRKHLPFNLTVTDLVNYWFKVLQIVGKIYTKRQTVNHVRQTFS